MSSTLLSVSPDYLYFHGEPPESVSKHHMPYFLVFTDAAGVDQARARLVEKLEENQDEENVFSKIEKIGEVETYRSFWYPQREKKVFKVFTKKSYHVPEVSDYLFFNYGLYTAEHDIPYHQRVLVDVAADDKFWVFDTHGKKVVLKVLVYDIETTQYDERKTCVPIDIIGFSDFNVTIESSKNLRDEEFSFEIIDIPSRWDNKNIEQMIAHDVDEELDNLYCFCKKTVNYDIISGHNILGFDNPQIYNRLKWFLANYESNLSKEQTRFLQGFTKKFCRVDKSFHFGIHSEIVQFYPSSLDTYMGVRKFYSFLSDYSLKNVAPFLGVHIPNRVVLTPSQIKLDERTLLYNKHDVMEQIGVTLSLMQQALPLAFTTCMPFEMLFNSGAVNMWDHMSLIRGRLHKKIMPPITRPINISKVLLKNFRNCETKTEIVKNAKKNREQVSKELLRVVKYGEEMPDWMEYPNVIYNENAEDADEILNYHMPGGMTIKPDTEACSHFIPWYHVIVADVGAMYPTILKAMNIGADTVRLAHKDEQPDEWIWLKKIPRVFLEKKDVRWREITQKDSFADRGYMLGIKIDDKPGVVNLAMTGIISMIAKIKKELKQLQDKGDSAELQRLKMMYQSLKGARNAGSHGILSAPGVSGRQFNLWGAAAITTKGQQILSDTLNYLEKNGIRVVYGDTDGIYMGCSRSMGNLPRFPGSLGVKIEKDEKKWITQPETAIDAIKKCNKKWQQELKYRDFELEPETHDVMIFVKHKNYLIFDEKNGKIEMTTKGNNFKGSDKPNIARKALKTIMLQVIKENPSWENEEDARKKIKKDIIDKAKDVISKIDLSQVEMDDLTLIQSVQPPGRYKPNQNGSMSTFGKRAAVLQQLLGRELKSRVKLRFVVTKKPLRGITNPSKSGVKPIDYMYPVELLEDKNDIDLEWYKTMIENYIKGAFGLTEMEMQKQTGLDAWM